MNRVVTLFHLLNLVLAFGLAAGKRRDDSLAPLDGIPDVQLADINHDLSTGRQGFLDELARRFSGLDVICPKVTASGARVRYVAIDSKQRHLTVNLFKEINLVASVIGADRTAFTPRGEQILDTAALLFGRTAARRHFELHIDVCFFGRRFRAPLGDLPEFVFIVAYE